MCYDFTNEPEGDIYRDILEYALKECDSAMLVVRPSLEFGSIGVSVLKQLEAFLIEKRLSSEWPGTQLLSDNAILYLFAYNSESVTLFKEACQGLYGWVQPFLPEDLCLLRSKDDPWLVSITHEKDGYLHQSEEEMLKLLDAIPGIRPILSAAPH